MAGSVNKVILIGNVGQDPDVKTFKDGGKIVNISMATSKSWKDKGSGERREITQWHKVSVKDSRLVEIAEKYVRKGSKIYIEGELETRSWEQDGATQYITEVCLNPFMGALTLMDSPNQSGSGSSSGQSSGGGGSGAGRGARTPDLDDEIPFDSPWR